MDMVFHMVYSSHREYLGFVSISGFCFCFCRVFCVLAGGQRRCCGFDGLLGVAWVFGWSSTLIFFFDVEVVGGWGERGGALVIQDQRRKKVG